MNIQKLRQNLQYTYSSSFRNIYDQKPEQTLPSQHSQRQSPTKIFIQYQKALIEIKSSKKHFFKDQNNTQQKKFSTINSTVENFVKPLHTSSKKYSFSVFVKKSKKNEQERKKKAISVEQKCSDSQKRIKGTRQINSVIRTMYENFRKFENMSKRSQASKSSRNSSLKDPKYQTISPQSIRQTTVRLNTNSTNPNNSITSSHRQLSHPYSQQQEVSSRSKINFVKTLTFDEKLQHSRQLQHFRTNQTSRGLLYITKQQIPFVDYSQSQYVTNSFLKIEKCNLEKKEQHFIKQSSDLRDTLLREKLEKDNRKKAADIINHITREGNGFVKYAPQTVRENKYVAQMRGVKKAKKQMVKNTNHKEDDSNRNKISPW